MTELDTEFCKAVIKLLANLYFSPNAVEIPQLPSVEGQKKVDTQLPFQSRVVDVKLRRAIDQRIKTHNELLESLPQLLSEHEQVRDPPRDLTERFRPAPAPRRETRKWVEVEEKAKADELDAKIKAKARHRALAQREAELERPNPEFRKRLQKAEAEGQRRARKRLEASNVRVPPVQ
jgi:hypothetical protein